MMLVLCQTGTQFLFKQCQTTNLASNPMSNVPNPSAGQDRSCTQWYTVYNYRQKLASILKQTDLPVLKSPKIGISFF